MGNRASVLDTGPFDVAAHAKAALREHLRSVVMLQILGNPILHAEVVAGGPHDFRYAMSRELGPFFAKHRAPCDELANIVFRFFQVQWRQRHPGVSPERFLDAVEIPSPPTPAEIDAAWEVDIGSSELAMRKFYEGSARVRKGADLFRAMKVQ